MDARWRKFNPKAKHPVWFAARWRWFEQLDCLQPAELVRFRKILMQINFPKVSPTIANTVE